MLIYEVQSLDMNNSVQDCIKNVDSLKRNHYGTTCIMKQHVNQAACKKGIMPSQNYLVLHVKRNGTSTRSKQTSAHCISSVR